MATVMIWASMALLSMLAIGFALCVIMVALGMWWQRDDRGMLLMYGMMLLISAALCTGLVFAVIALGRNVA